MTSTVKKRRALSVQEKVRMIELLEAGASNANVCRYVGVSQSTLSTIWKSREHFKNVFYSDLAHKKKLKSSQHKDIEQALLAWFKVQRSLNVPISGPILQEKADDFAKLLNKPNFKCSSSWITRFRKRHNIVFRRNQEDPTASARISFLDIFENWLEIVWPDIRQGFSDDNVYNADETAFFYKLTPDRSMYYRGETCRGGEMANDRLTVLVTANMTGNDKCKLLVIGRPTAPICFNNVYHSVSYTSNTRAWMSSEIFTQWLKQWDQELIESNRKILLTVGNCPSHSPVLNLKNIKLVFLPPNATRVLKPMEEGIIQTLKVNYRRRLLLKVVNREEQDKELKISIFDAMRMLQDSWDDVTNVTIRNCFRKSGFMGVSETEEYRDGSENALDEWRSNLNEPLSPEELLSYAEVDEKVMTSDMRTDTQIAESLLKAENGDDSREKEDSDDAYHVPTLSEAFYCLDQVRAFVDGRPEIAEQIPEATSVLTKIAKLMEMSYFLKTEDQGISGFHLSNS